MSIAKQFVMKTFLMLKPIKMFRHNYARVILATMLGISKENEKKKIEYIAALLWG